VSRHIQMLNWILFKISLCAATELHSHFQMVKEELLRCLDDTRRSSEYRTLEISGDGDVYFA
jgi:hypothetical protein